MSMSPESEHPSPNDQSEQPEQPEQPTGSGDRVGSTEAPGAQAVVGQVRWWVAAGTFVAGLLVGVVVAALIITGGPTLTGSSGEDEGQGAGGDQPSGYSSVPVTAEARVNAACLRVINEAQDVVRILSGSDEAVTDVDLQRLDDIVRRLQPVESRLERDLRECRVDTDVRSGSTASPASPVPTVPQPSPSPTR